MSSVAILGAGEIGGSAARLLTARGRVSAVRLIDEHRDIASGKALDIRQSCPIAGSDVRIDGSTDQSAAAGATVILLADSAEGGEWNGEQGLALLRRLQRVGVLRETILVCAGSGHLRLVQQALDELGLNRSKVFGCAPEALASAARALVAIEARTSPAQVCLSVLGDPPGRTVIPWEDASIAGHAVTTLLTPPQLNLVEHRLKGLWPPGPTALGSAAALFCEAVASGSRRLVSAFVSLDRENGTKAPVCAWPVAIGPGGLARVTTPTLTTRNRVVLDEVIGS